MKKDRNEVPQPSTLDKRQNTDLRNIGQINNQNELPKMVSEIRFEDDSTGYDLFPFGLCFQR